MNVHGEPSQDPRSGADRRLGDEWEDWNGQLDSGDSYAPAWFFILLSVLAVFFLWGGGLLAAWLVYPRLAALGIAFLTWLLAGLWTAYLGIWYTAVLMAMFSQDGAMRPWVRHLGGIAWMAAPAVFLGRGFGISRDKVFHSFMLVHNRLEVLPPVVAEPEKLLLLVPRCLNRSVFQALAELKSRYGFTQMTVTGGTEARRAIAKLRPRGVIAVACERDLIAGVKDVKGRVPVLAFSNRRPEGPCQNTLVDMEQIENAIKLFLGQSLAKEEKGS